MHRCLVALILALCSLPIAASSASAADPASIDASLKYIPVDAAFYGTLLRGREQYDLIVNSKAYKQLANLAVVKKAIAELTEQWENDEDYDELREFMERDDVKEVTTLVPQMFSDEVFFYFDAKTARLLRLQKQTQIAQWRMMLRMMKDLQAGEVPDAEVGQRTLYEAFISQIDSLEVPTLLVGFRIRDKAMANKQLDKLEAALQPKIDEVPQLKGRLKRTDIGGDKLLTLNLDGSMIPWAEFEDDLARFQTKPGQLDALKKKVTPQKLTLTLGVRSNYIVLSLGPGVEHLAPFGGPGLGAKSLAAHPLMQRLAPHADKRITAVAYISEDYASSASYSPADIAEIGTMIDEEAPWKNLPDNLELRVRSDVHEMFQDLAWAMPKPQALASCSFITPAGMEGYSYTSLPPAWYDASKPLTILEHAGPNPLFVWAARHKKESSLYPGTVKWIGILTGYVLDQAQEQGPPEQQEKVKETLKVLKPLWQRFDETTKKKFLASLADGQSAWVLGQFPVGEKRPPMLSLFPSPAMVWSVSDPKLLVESMNDYRAILEDLLGLGQKLAPEGALPPIKIPAPTIKTTATGTIYSFDIPLKDDSEKLTLAAGLGSDTAVVCLSPAHAEQILKPTTLAGKGALADPKAPSASAMKFETAGLIDSFLPSINLAMAFAPNDQDTQQALEVFRAVMDAMKVFRSTSSRTYVESGGTVVHGVTEIRDVP